MPAPSAPAALIPEVDPTAAGPPPALVLAVVIATVVFPSPYVLHVWSPASRNYFTATLVLPADLGLVIALVTAGPVLLAAARRRHIGPGARVWAATAGALLLAFPWHPSGRGILTICHLAGCAAVAASAAAVLASTWRRLLVGVICAAGAVESLITVLQMTRQRPVGLGRIGEVSFPFYPFSHRLAPAGTFPHPYLAAGFALVTAGVATVMALEPDQPRPGRWAALAGWCVVPVGLSYSRSALLGLACLTVLAGWSCLHRRRQGGAVVVALALGAGVPAALWPTQWLARGANSLTTGGITNGRTSMVHQALSLIGAHPLTGIGPGRYVFALEQRYGVANAPRATGYGAVHNLALLAGAEGGVLALAIVGAGLVWLVWRAARSGPLALGVCLAFLPYCLADQFPYESAQGAVMCALWLASVDALIVAGRSRWSPAAPQPAGARAGVIPPGPAVS